MRCTRSRDGDVYDDDLLNKDCETETCTTSCRSCAVRAAPSPRSLCRVCSLCGPTGARSSLCRLSSAERCAARAHQQRAGDVESAAFTALYAPAAAARFSDAVGGAHLCAAHDRLESSLSFCPNAGSSCWICQADTPLYLMVATAQTLEFEKVENYV